MESAIPEGLTIFAILESFPRGSSVSPRGQQQNYATDNGNNAKNWQERDGVCAFSRDLQRPNVDRLLRGRVGDALVGQGHHTENDHQNRYEEEIFHKISGAQSGRLDVNGNNSGISEQGNSQ